MEYKLIFVAVVVAISGCVIACGLGEIARALRDIYWFLKRRDNDG